MFMIKIKRIPIDEFIKKFKEGFSEESIIECFTEGNCYHFAVILKNIYKEGRIVHDYLINHFLLEYKGKYYDITGEVFYDKYENFEYFDDLFYSDINRYLKLMRDCVLKIDYFKGISNEYYSD